jgi:hypothetical protein
MLTTFDKEDDMDDTTRERVDAAGLSPWDAAAFRVFAVIAVLAGLLALGWGVNAVIALAEGRLAVDLPLVTPQAVSLPGVGVDTALLDEVTVVSGDVGSGALVALAAGSILSALIGATVAAAVALLLWRLAQGRPFHHTLFGMTLLAGAAMSIGGLLAAFASGFGAMQVAFDPEGEVFVPGFTLDPSVIAVGAVVLALAFVFRAGTHLQRDTDGLV